MASQWQNFLRNLGEWSGTFATLSPSGELISEMPSLLSLEADEGGALVHFRLRNYGAGGSEAPPVRDLQQEYRSLGRQVVFFETGTFCKGTLQQAPATASGAEFGFVHGDRRHRLVMLFDTTGDPEKLVLIREFRTGVEALERPPLSPDQLSGVWHGSRTVLTNDWFHPETTEVTLEFDEQEIADLLLLPDGGYCRWPSKVSHRQAFQIEAGWLPEADRLERLIRTYDATGAWQESIHQILLRQN